MDTLTQTTTAKALLLRPLWLAPFLVVLVVLLFLSGANFDPARTAESASLRPSDGLVELGIRDFSPTSTPTPVHIYTVTHTNDTGTGSLRQSITSANASPGHDQISFNIPGPGLHTISPGSNLPDITESVIIDGYTQPGSSCNTLGAGDDAVLRIVLSGNNTVHDGLIIKGGNTTVRGLVINSFTSVGITLVITGGNTIQGNFIGTNSVGTAAQPNGDTGLYVGSGSDGNLVGGADLCDRNLISGNARVGVLIGGAPTGGTGATDNVVQGNYIGTNAEGNSPVGNGQVGILIQTASYNIIGGRDAGEGNLISGNARSGINIVNTTGTGDSNLVQGNFIGTNATGTGPLGNTGHGVEIGSGQAGNLIGGMEQGDGNRIAYNTRAGVAFLSQAGLGNAVRGNAVYSNGALGIDLLEDGVTLNDVNDGDGGPNNKQNFPVVAAIAGRDISASLNSAANQSYVIEVFLSPTCDLSSHGEGALLAGRQTVITTGNSVSFTFVLGFDPPPGSFITMTATDSAGSTSEFSHCFQVPMPTPTVTLTPTPAPPTAVPNPCRPTLPTATATPPYTGSYIDLQPFQPFYGYIQCLSAWGIIGGYGDATFRPAASVTRGQIAKILSNSADLDADVSGMRTFQDVLPGDPFWGFAEQLAAQGAINGYPCGGPGEPCGQGDLPYFRPGNNATRGQIAKMTTLTSDLTDPVADGQQTFQDVPPGQPFWLPIEQLTRRGVINGYPCGGPGEPCGPGDLPYFRSGNNASRGQLSKITSLLFFPGCVWSAPSGPTDDEMLGGGNPSEGSTTGRAGVNVNTATGNFWYSATDFAVPGRGPGLLLTRTYNVQAASVNGRFGFGWTDSYNMYIEGLATSNLIVHQENGSTLPFTFGNAAYLHDPRVLAELVHNSVGSYSLTRTQGQMRFLFDELGKLAQVRDRNHYVTSLSYAGARLASVQDPAGRRLLFTYDSKGRVTTVQDPSGNRHASYTYDTRGNLGSVTDVTGHITRFTYDDNHRMETITDPKGGVLQNSYGAMYRVKSQVGPGCRVYDFTYATSGNHVVTTITDPRSIVSVHTHTSGRLTKVVEDARGAAPATWRYGYRAGYISGLAMVVDPNGHVWRATWNPQGDRLTATDPLGHTTTATYNATHDLLALTNPLGLTTSYVPDTAGNLLSVSRPLVPPDQVTTLYTYDPTHPGDLIAATDPDGHTWQFTYHPVSGNRLTSTNPLNQTTYYTYDGVGRILSSTTPLGHVTIYTYNAYGDLLTLTDPLGHTTRYTYDGNRHIVAVQDANGHVTLTTYDLANQRVRETRPDLTYSDYAYDADGNLVRQTNSLGQSTLYVYDPFNRLIDSSDALHRITHYRYDSAGRWISTIDSASPPRTTSYAYDNANRLTSISYSDGTTPNVSYSYDPAGRRTSMRDGTGTTSYTYDSLDRLTQEANGASQAVTYGYDLRGNTLNVGYPGGRTVQYDYDPANRMTSLNDGDSRTTQFTYDLDGNLSAHLYPNNTRVDMTYDLAGRLASTAHSHNGTTFLSLGYTRDSMGLLQGLADSVAGPRTYAYDGLDRLTGDTAGASDTRTWDYDGAYRITGSSTMAGGVQWTTIRGYGATDELSTLVETQTGSPTRNLGFTYNSVGDRVSQTDSANGPTTYNYDQVSRLTGYTRGASTTYAYNGDGLRMSKSVGGGASEQFTWDTRSSPPRLFAAGQDAYIWGPSDLLVERLASRVPYFYHLDQQGSTRALTDLSGNVAAAASYDPYGGPPGGSGKLGPFGYVGAYRDAESDLLYLGDRYYDLATQQYITTGRRVPGERAYAYAADNPLNVDQPAGQLAMGPLARRDLFLFAPCTTPASALPDASCARGGTLWWETQGGPSWASTGSIWPRGNSTVLAERIAESTLPFPTWGSGSSANAIVVTADPFGWYRLPFSIKGVGSRGNSVVVTQNPMNEYTLPLPTWGRGACAVP